MCVLLCLVLLLYLGLLFERWTNSVSLWFEVTSVPQCAMSVCLSVLSCSFEGFCLELDNLPKGLRLTLSKAGVIDP